MRDIALGIVIGIVIGAIAVYAATAKPPEEGLCPANAVLDKNKIESGTKKLNELDHMNNHRAKFHTLIDSSLSCFQRCA